MAILQADSYLVYFTNKITQKKFPVPFVYYNKEHWLWTEESFKKFQNAISLKISKIPSIG